MMSLGSFTPGAIHMTVLVAPKDSESAAGQPYKLSRAARTRLLRVRHTLHVQEHARVLP